MAVLVAAGTLLGGTTSACTEDRAPFASDAVVTHDRSGTMHTERFLVSWTLEYGFRLTPRDNPDMDITPVFAGQGTEAAFTAFFAPDNLAKLVGKKALCECVGDRREEDGRTVFRISKAHLFAD